MKTRVVILALLILGGFAFCFAPPLINPRAAVEQVAHRAIFGDVESLIAKICTKKPKFGGAAGKVMGLGSKDVWGEDVVFTWRNDSEITLRSGGPDKVQGTNDDATAVASCGSNLLKRDGKQ